MANKISVLIDVAVDGANRSLTSFRKSLADAEGASGKFKVAASGAFDQLKQNAGNLALAGGAALVAFGVKAVGAFQETALGAGELRDSLGLTAEEASKYLETAGDLGISVEALQATMGRMNRTAADTPGAFSAINAELVRNADGSLNVNETFLSTVDALNKIPDASKRASAAQKIFGRSWMDIAEMVGQGADGLRESLDSVEAGKILGDDDIDDARAFRDSLDSLKGVSEELAITVGAVLVPALTQAADATMGLKNAAGGLDDALGPVDESLGSIIKKNWQYLNPVGQAVTLLGKFKGSSDDASDALYTQAQSLIEASIATAKQEQATEDATAADEAAAKAAENRADELDGMRQEIDAARQATERATQATIEAGNSDLAYRNTVARTSATIAESNAIQMDATKTSEEHAQAARDAEGAVYDQAAAAVKLAEDQAAASGQTLTAEQSAKIYRDELGRLSASLTGDAAIAVQMYIDALNRIPKSIYTNIGTTRSGDFGPALTGRRAAGGPVSPGGTYLVGEEGPELLQMGASSGNVIPNGATVGGGGSYTYNIVMPPGSDGDSVVRALRQYARRNGPIQGIT